MHGPIPIGHKRRSTLRQHVVATAKTATLITAQISPAGQRIDVGPEQTLLQAALNAGIAFPHNCRVGSCATCKCRLLSGKVKELTDRAYALSAEDLRGGYILACQTRLITDVEIELDHLAPNSPANPARMSSK